jgi:hypothetical protein
LAAATGDGGAGSIRSSVAVANGSSRSPSTGVGDPLSTTTSSIDPRSMPRW